MVPLVVEPAAVTSLGVFHSSFQPGGDFPPQKYGTFPSTYEIVGFDNSPIASAAILPLTTVGQQLALIATTAMEDRKSVE